MKTSTLVVGSSVAVAITPADDCGEVHIFENGRGATAGILLYMPTPNDVPVSRPAGDEIVLRAPGGPLQAKLTAGVTLAYIKAASGSITVAVEEY